MPDTERAFSILNVRSASTPSDLTTRARIRDTAVAAFADNGFATTSVRSIATAAGVSAALVLHHFGSKDGLRESCDEHVAALLAQETEALLKRDATANVLAKLDQNPEYLVLGRYIRTSLLAGGDFAERMFGVLVENTERYLDAAEAAGEVLPTADPHGRAIVLVAMSVGLQFLASYVAPPGTPDEHLPMAIAQRVGIPMLEIYTDGLYTDSAVLDAVRRQLNN